MLGCLVLSTSAFWRVCTYRDTMRHLDACDAPSPLLYKRPNTHAIDLFQPRAAPGVAGPGARARPGLPVCLFTTFYGFIDLMLLLLVAACTCVHSSTHAPMHLSIQPSPLCHVDPPAQRPNMPYALNNTMQCSDALAAAAANASALLLPDSSTSVHGPLVPRKRPLKVRVHVSV